MIKMMVILTFITMNGLILSGCGTIFKQPSIEQMGMIGVMGFDVAKDNKVDISVVLPISLPSGIEETKVYKANATVTHEGLTKISRKSDKTINLGQLRVVLLSEKLVKTREIDRFIKDLYRNPQVGDQVLLAVVKGNVYQMLDQHSNDQEPIGKFLYDFLAPREDIAFSPFTTMHSYMYHETDLITDPMVPTIKIEGDQLDITGIALFKKGKMIDEIHAQDAKLFQGLAYRHKLPALKLNLSNNEQAVLSFVKSNFNIHSNHQLTNTQLTINLKLTGIIDDYHGKKDLSNPKNLNELEREINKVLTKETYNLVKRFQKLRVDPVGLGESVRKYYPKPWSKGRWDEALANAHIKVHISTEIVSTGMLK